MKKLEFYTKAPGLVETDIGGQILIYNPDCEEFYALSDSMGIAWRLIDFCSSIDELETRLKRIYASENSKTIGMRAKKNIDELLALKMLIPAAVPAIRPAAFDITLQPTTRKFAPGVITIYKADWIMKNHPGAFYRTSYGDFWEPASPTKRRPKR